MPGAIQADQLSPTPSAHTGNSDTLANHCQVRGGLTDWLTYGRILFNEDALMTSNISVFCESLISHRGNSHKET